MGFHLGFLLFMGFHLLCYTKPGMSIRSRIPVWESCCSESPSRLLRNQTTPHSRSPAHFLLHVHVFPLRQGAKHRYPHAEEGTLGTAGSTHTHSRHRSDGHSCTRVSPATSSRRGSAPIPSSVGPSPSAPLHDQQCSPPRRTASSSSLCRP